MIHFINIMKFFSNKYFYVSLLAGNIAAAAVAHCIASILIASADTNKAGFIILMTGCIILFNASVLYIKKTIDEKNYYKLQIQMLQQQKKLQNENYEIQREKYEEAARILHDVNKHIKMLERLYQEMQEEEAVKYAKETKGIISPFLSFPYADNLILNCLLCEKSKISDELGIDLKIEIATADISFMNMADITTLFGNLMDNAIAACRKCRREKYIGIFIKEFNDILSIRVENTVFKPVAVKEGRIVHTGDGIGVWNIQHCVEAYEGNIVYKSKDNKLICDIILNRTNRLEKLQY